MSGKNHLRVREIFLSKKEKLFNFCIVYLYDGLSYHFVKTILIKTMINWTSTELQRKNKLTKIYRPHYTNMKQSRLISFFKLGCESVERSLNFPWKTWYKNKANHASNCCSFRSRRDISSIEKFKMNFIWNRMKTNYFFSKAIFIFIKFDGIFFLVIRVCLISVEIFI